MLLSIISVTKGKWEEFHVTKKLLLLNGNVGAWLSNTAWIARRSLDDYVLIDTNEAKVKADRQTFALRYRNNLNHHANITLILVKLLYVYATWCYYFSLRNIFIKLQRQSKCWPICRAAFTTKRWLSKIKEVGFKGFDNTITNPVDVTNIPVAFKARPSERKGDWYRQFYRYHRDEEAGSWSVLVAIRSLLTGSSEHGNSQFTAWSQVWVKGKP